MVICAATGNAGKLRELRRILEAQGHQVKSQKELRIYLEPEETGTTFEENAVIKAREVCQVSGLPTVADDSGLVVDALGGEPGVYSARYSGQHGDDQANNDKLLKKLGDLPKEQRTAKFVSAVCLYLPDGRSLTVTGECPGWVGFERKGTNGFGYDPLFNLSQYDDRSYAQLSDEEKDAVSHRGRALAKLEQLLPDFLNHNNEGINDANQ